MAKTDLKILKGMTMVRSGGCTAHVNMHLKMLVWYDNYIFIDEERQVQV